MAAVIVREPTPRLDDRTTVTDETHLQDWFDGFYRQHHRQVLAYALRRCHDRDQAEDVAAQTFLIAWKRIADLPDEPHQAAWLYATAYRVLGNLFRTNRRRRRMCERLQLQRPSPATTDALVAAGIDFDVFARALQSLSDADQEILLLAGWEQLPHAEIAIGFDIAVATVAVRLHRARNHLAEHYARKASSNRHTGAVGPRRRTS